MGFKGQTDPGAAENGAFRPLPMDEESNYHTFERLMADEEKWAQVQDPTSEGHAMFQGMLAALFCFADRLRAFRQ